MWRVKVENRIDRDDPVWIDAVVIMPHDMGETDRLRDAGHFKKGARVVPEVWIVYETLAIALKIQVVDLIKAHQRRRIRPEMLRTLPDKLRCSPYLKWDHSSVPSRYASLLAKNPARRR